jgi:RHH-type proline utilization regulon transcriptional repressor/proline dehydrogenase/delta 1-pyrroline-5-carboxylate dehydrogenase
MLARMTFPGHDVENALVDRAVAVARALQERAAVLQTPSERRQQAELDRMLQTPEDKVTLVQLTDEVFRSNAAGRTAEHLTHILDVQGVPRFFSPLDRALLRGFQTFGGWLPGVSVPMVKEHMQNETANVVLPAETDLLREHLRARQVDGVRMNLNFLGEAVLGEEEAAHRLEKYLEALQLPEVEVLSVKISTLYSQLSPMARDETLRVLCDRLEVLYRSADRLRFRRPDGTLVPKFIYLDMEEYRDLQLTARAFMATLDRPGLEGVSAGMALQAYIPDSARVQRDITAWARLRVQGGGAPVTLRIVKGANMEMERVEASLRGWPQAPFPTKRETDANYKRMLHAALQPENLAAVRVGVASHNIFDLAFGLVLAAEARAGDRVQFEMLEGMANHQRRALLEQTRHLLLYAPACRKEEFLNAIGYLIRRLDENTGPENFLRHAFKLETGSPEWEVLENGFRAAFRTAVSDAPRRTQSRLIERFVSPRPEMRWDAFENEPDTDWSLPANGDWARQIVARTDAAAVEIPLVIAGGEVTRSARRDDTRQSLDPSRPGVVLARYVPADEADVDRAVAAAKADHTGWRTLDVAARNEILGRVAHELRQARAPLMWAALANGGKTLAESDVEVSEAVDFVEFYRASARFFHGQPDLETGPRGVVVVVPPWNFPIAIPCGGIAAALAAGNTVILKPASDTVLVAWELCQCFWRAGVPTEALQFLPGPGSGAGARLVAHPDVDAVILTGGTETARRMIEARPDMRLFAETGGKNASVVTALSDRELAIKHVVQSAFGHSGQKCSATSLLLLEAELYDDPHFKRTLCDAVQSLRVGSAWELETKVGPLIRPPVGELDTALKTLEPGESWAVLPRRVGDAFNLWSPGVKYGVTAGSFTHLTEFFGPVLGVMRFESLDEAITLVNQTGYGLTSGLHSLDEREHERWMAQVHAGNLYINRGTTGAIVLRQPFGGMGRSVFGPGLKAGGPNYVAQFLRFADRPVRATAGESIPHPDLQALAAEIARLGDALALDDATRLWSALRSYAVWWRDEFSRAHDDFRLLGQDNLRRYLPFGTIRVQVTASDTAFDLLARAAAARVTGARVLVSRPPGCLPRALELLGRATKAWEHGVTLIEETEEDVIRVIRNLPAHAHDRLRYAAPDRVPPAVRTAAAQSAVHLADEPVLAHGRIELLWYLREQSVCSDYHRYGNLGARAGETRRQPA